MPGRAAAADGWLTDTEEQPRADTGSGDRFRRRARFYRVYLLAAAVLAPLLLLALVAAVSASPVPASGSPQVRDSPGRAAATQAMLDWLSGPNPGLLDGRLLQWSGASVAPAPVPESASTARDVALSVEVDTFVVVDGAGNRFTAEFQVALDGRDRASVLSGPSLTPLPALDPEAARNAGPWPGRAVVPTAEQVSAAVRAWAAAYTSGDPGALRLTVGDPDRGRTYQPLTGVAAVTATVGPCTALDAATVAVRVQLAIRWAATAPQTPAAAPATGEPPAPPPAAFDVLVTGADTAAPRVVAWGGPGTGPALVPYGNAVTGDPAPAGPAAPTVTWVPPTAGSGPAG